MKNAWSLPLVILLIAISAPKASHGLEAANPELSRLLNEENVGRLLLVAFPDQTMDRMDVSPDLTAYRGKRGAYQSSTWGRRITAQIAEDYHLKKLTEWPMSAVSVHCAVYQVPTDASVSLALQQLAKDTRVSIVQPMHLFTTQAQQYNDPYFKLQSNLRHMGIDQAHDITTGKNVTIAMIDTGVDLLHPDLIGQIAQDENVAAAFSPGFSNDKHGTAVAGMMAARKDNGVGIVGVAPDAKLIAIKACWPHQADAIAAVCNSLTLALAVNSAMKSGAKILNMSISGPQDTLLELLLNEAIAEGMIVVAAASNQGRADQNFPASLQKVISVQALTTSDANHLNIQKNMTAPGEKILTTQPHGVYDFISGNSMSAAEVSGIIALLMEINPNLTFADIEAVLEKSQSLSKKTSFQGINANAAILSLCETTTCPESALSLARKNFSSDPGLTPHL